MSGIQIVHEGEGSSSGRFVLKEGEVEVSYLEYEITAGGVMSMLHTFSDPKGRGKGYAAIVTKAAMDWAKSQGHLKVDPACWYVRDSFLPKHPEYKSLL